MRIIGYCSSCHRVRQVTVSGHGMASIAAGGAATGVCADCEEKDEIHRTLRSRRLSTVAYDRLPPRLQDEAKSEIRRGNWERVAELLSS